MREQSYGKLLSVQRRVIKTDRFGLSTPMVPALGAVGGETHQNDLEDSTAPGIQRKAGMSLRRAPKGRSLSIFILVGPPWLKGSPQAQWELKAKSQSQWLEGQSKLY